VLHTPGAAVCKPRCSRPYRCDSSG
jgi:hypothetical protein